jgi:hypothetical protein
MKCAQAATLMAVLALALPARADEANCKSCGKEKYGTTIEWAGSPSDAAKIARDKEKLVFVLHVSGYFEDPKFT